ncbi:MAG TPA: lytic transglycosylase domain-containing protein [Alphaproteobacteria bacterium]|nr:lytic transglycosylase domain-containing protein [Alphaproteobacteria bacterium]
MRWNLVGGVRPGKATLRMAVAAVLTVVLFTPPAAAAFTKAELSATRTVMADIDRGRYNDAYDAAEAAHFPLLRKIVAWFDYTHQGTAVSFDQVTAFIQQNPDWPQQNALKKRAESVIDDTVQPSVLVKWFQANPPLTPDGAGHYIDALNATNQHSAAEATARQFLVDGTMNSNRVADFAGRYRPMLREVDFELRVDRLIWAGNAQEASAELSYLDPGARAVAQTRIAFATGSSNAMGMFSQLSRDQQNDLGLLYDRMRWMRKQNRDSEAISLLAVAPPTLPHADLWWNERASLARRALESGDAKTAYELARDHRQASGAALADGEWFSGWLALRFLHDPKAALAHFKTMQGTVKFGRSIARAAYWMGRTEEELGDQAEADRQYRAASSYPAFYYGQLALAKISPSSRLSLPAQPQVGGLEARTFGNRELVQVAELFTAIGQSDLGEPFIRRLIELARTPEDSLLAMHLAKANNTVSAQVRVAKKLMVEDKMPILADGFPLMPSTPKAPEPAFIHAIIRQESEFNQKAVSPSGALGLMQLLPGTARDQANKMKMKKFNVKSLTADPRVNMALGSGYLNGLIERFDGSYVMAAAGYNGGPGHVITWEEEYGRPSGDLDKAIDWVEKITLNETRNYVQYVMENLQIYRARLSGGSTQNNIAKDLIR